MLNTNIVLFAKKIVINPQRSLLPFWVVRACGRAGVRAFVLACRCAGLLECLCVCDDVRSCGRAFVHSIWCAEMRVCGREGSCVRACKRAGMPADGQVGERACGREYNILASFCLCVHACVCSCVRACM